jgi:hypothetical protein
MKKLIIFLLVFAPFTLFAQQPKKPIIDSSKLYKWGNKMLTKKQLRDTLKVYHHKFTTK